MPDPRRLNVSTHEIDLRQMRRALSLASLGLGTAAPNPLVGAVLVRGAKIVGEGFHRRVGEAHAEAIALARASSAARGATLYTNLEPCCHTGHTPPCVGEILRAGVERVVVAMRDPDPRVNGGGFRKLRRGGVKVDVGLLRPEAERLNRAFVKHVKRGLPMVTLKGAITLDGRIATKQGDSKWITSLEARQHARILRREHDAVMVGVGTMLADDPRLNRRPRLPGSAPFLRVVLDSSLRTPPEARVLSTLRDGPLIFFCGPKATLRRRRSLEQAGAEVCALTSEGPLRLAEVLENLGNRGVSRLLVEGGGEIHASFIKEGLADRLVLYLSPRLMGGRESRPLIGGEGPDRITELGRLTATRCSRIGDGWLIEGDL